jgi:hypothetical protein
VSWPPHKDWDHS